MGIEIYSMFLFSVSSYLCNVYGDEVTFILR